MKTCRQLLLLLIAFSLLDFSLSARAQDAASYWPFKVGNTWTLNTKVNDKVLVAIIKVTKIVPAQGTQSDAYLEYTIDGNVTQVEIYRFDDKGIARVGSGKDGSTRLDPPFTMIQYPPTDGSKWVWTGKISVGDNKFAATSNMSASGPETIKTAAGEFKAVKIHSDLTMTLPDGTSMALPNDYWFAPGVGLVQQRAVVNGMTIDGSLTSYKLQ
jgi:hypothetical protein